MELLTMLLGPDKRKARFAAWRTEEMAAFAEYSQGCYRNSQGIVAPTKATDAYKTRLGEIRRKYGIDV